MSMLSNVANPVQLWPPALRSIYPIGAPEVCQLERQLHRFNSAARGQIAFLFYKIVFCGSRKKAELWKPTQDQIQAGGQRPNF